jgi:4-diphosphocytidyl-2-C-methyl-D-erythritol kinase
MNKPLRLPAYAKINLCLHILGRRPDGYHELRTIFQAISLHDVLELSFTRGGQISLEVDDAALTAGPENLVWRAIEAMRHELDITEGIHARLEKRIPVARGLGGGSSDAAAALIGALRLARKKIPLARLIEIAAGLGADVPFFLFGGRALGVSRGDEIYPLPDLPSGTVLIVSPHNIAVSTKDAYAWASSELCAESSAQRQASPAAKPSELTNPAPTPKIFRFCALCWSRQGTSISNDFEAPVFSRHPRLQQIRAGLLQRGAAEAALAGSGSAVFGIFRNPAQARRAAREFSKDSVFVVETLSRQKYGRALGWRVAG